MNRPIRCIDCFWLGYFRIEQARGGGTTYFQPETLPLEVRNKLLREPQTFDQSLSVLLARDRRIACLSEITDPSGQRRPVEPAYENLVAEKDFAKIQQTASGPRLCGRFGGFDPNLSFNDVRNSSTEERNRPNCLINSSAESSISKHKLVINISRTRIRQSIDPAEKRQDVRGMAWNSFFCSRY